MPRKYPNRVKREKRYDEKTLQKALVRLRDRRNPVTFHKVSKMYGIPCSTLSYRLSGKSTPSMGHPPVLTVEEEETLVQWIKDIHEHGLILSKYEVSLKVKDMLDNAGRESRFTNNTPGQDWWKCFKLRHKELTFKRYQYLRDGSEIQRPDQYLYHEQNGNTEEDMSDKDHALYENEETQTIVQIAHGDSSDDEESSSYLKEYSRSDCDDLFFLSISEQIKMLPPICSSELKVMILQLIASAESLSQENEESTNDGIKLIDKDIHFCDHIPLDIKQEVSESQTTLVQVSHTDESKNSESSSLSDNFPKSSQDGGDNVDRDDMFFMMISDRIKAFSPSYSSQLKVEILKLIQEAESS